MPRPLQAPARVCAVGAWANPWLYNYGDLMLFMPPLLPLLCKPNMRTRMKAVSEMEDSHMHTLASVCETVSASESPETVGDPDAAAHMQFLGLLQVFNRAYYDHAMAVRALQEATLQRDQDLSAKQDFERVLDTLCRRAFENAFVFLSYISRPADVRMIEMAQVMAHNRTQFPDSEGFSVASVVHAMKCRSWTLAKDASGRVNVIPSCVMI